MEQGKKLTEAEIRADEREAVMKVVHRGIHSSNFIRVKRAVDADAEARAKVRATQCA